MDATIKIGAIAVSVLIGTAFGLQLACWVWNKWLAGAAENSEQTDGGRELEPQVIVDQFGQELAPIADDTEPGLRITPPGFPRAFAACFLCGCATVLILLVTGPFLGWSIRQGELPVLGWLVGGVAWFVAASLINWSFLRTPLQRAIGVTALTILVGGACALAFGGVLYSVLGIADTANAP